MLFFSGWHQPNNGASGCGAFDRCMISVNRLQEGGGKYGRKTPFAVKDWILDSGAFTRISLGRGHLSVKRYAKAIDRWRHCGSLVAAASQDYMCESFILSKTGLTVGDHQRLTLHRYDRLRQELEGLQCPTYLLPVLQGFTPAEYVGHLKDYGDRLPRGAWVGVGSVCKRNGNPSQVESILIAIKTDRPDLRLHGFGLKETALKSSIVWDLLYSADSMAASFAARISGKSANDPRVAIAYAQRIQPPMQKSIFSA